VRRMIAEQGLDPAQIRGTGEGGRITRNDVVEATRGQAPVAPAPTAAAVARASGDEVVPFDNIRRRTAEHMVRSKATSAHVYTSVRVDFERVERARRANQAAWKAEEGFSLTYLPFIVRAFCDVVHDYPHVNASVDGDSLVVHRDLHLGIAVDLDFKGLVAPVSRDADGKRLRLIAREIRDLAARAKSKQLGPDEVVGGTFTITNMGPFGTTLTLPIINQPQVAIMATDGIRKEAVVVEGPDGDDTIAIHHVGLLALAWDHRAFDGAYAASFMNEIREILETRDWDAELA
jgi:pyruvate dehydrogenase E2 component (dihydrolipoamide acetyltransferase)